MSRTDISSLSQAQQDQLLLAYLDGCCCEDVSDKLGIPLSVVSGLFDYLSQLEQPATHPKHNELECDFFLPEEVLDKMARECTKTAKADIHTLYANRKEQVEASLAAAVTGLCIRDANAEIKQSVDLLKTLIKHLQKQVATLQSIQSDSGTHLLLSATATKCNISFDEKIQNAHQDIEVYQALLSELQAGKTSGRPKVLVGIESFILQLAHFYQDFTGRKFTVDFHEDGSAISEGCRFVEVAMTAIDNLARRAWLPPYPKSSVQTACHLAQKSCQ